ncbi:MAG: hypothetical protein IT324_29220 [Anaerolineae bacterium]|nr:hypothetical protein [Anaerolineae bacterium]
MNNLVEQPDSTVSKAIFHTLLYADVFSFPMTDAEIHHFLIGLSASSTDVQIGLKQSHWLAQRIERVNGYCAIKGHAHMAHQRHSREAASKALWPVARRYGVLLAHLPFVRMVALTGALAMRNASDSQDDIDYILVTAPGRVWTARALTVLIVRIARLWHVGLCPNYVLAETALVQMRQDLFIAHELAQMVPLAGFHIYEAMRTANGWSMPLLPNAQGPFYKEADHRPYGIGRLLQQLGELILGGRIGDTFEQWEQRRKMRKFSADARKPGSSAQIDDQRVKGHFNDYGTPALNEYRARLERYGLTGTAQQAAPQVVGYNSEMMGSDG